MKLFLNLFKKHTIIEEKKELSNNNIITDSFVAVNESLNKNYISDISEIKKIYGKNCIFIKSNIIFRLNIEKFEVGPLELLDLKLPNYGAEHIFLVKDDSIIELTTNESNFDKVKYLQYFCGKAVSISKNFINFDIKKAWNYCSGESLFFISHKPYMILQREDKIRVDFGLYTGNSEKESVSLPCINNEIFNLKEEIIECLSLFSEYYPVDSIAFFLNKSVDYVQNLIDNFCKMFLGDNGKAIRICFLNLYKTNPVYINIVEKFQKFYYSFYIYKDDDIVIGNNLLTLKNDNYKSYVEFDKENESFVLLPGSKYAKDILITKNWLDMPILELKRKEMNDMSIKKDNYLLLFSNIEFDSLLELTCCIFGKYIDKIDALWDNYKIINNYNTSVIEEDNTTSEKNDIETAIIDEFILDNETVEKNKNEEAIEQIKKRFALNDLKKKLNKYNIASTCRFLEEIYGKMIVSNINKDNLSDFIDDFDMCLNSLKPKAKNILIEKYGLSSGVCKTAIDISKNYDMTTSGISTSIFNSLNILKKLPEINELKKYFIIHDNGSTSDKDKEDIDFVMSLMD